MVPRGGFSAAPHAEFFKRTSNRTRAGKTGGVYADWNAALPGCGITGAKSEVWSDREALYVLESPRALILFFIVLFSVVLYAVELTDKPETKRNEYKTRVTPCSFVGVQLTRSSLAKRSHFYGNTLLIHTQELCAGNNSSN